YTAMFRRIRRYTTKQRTDMIDGTDLIYDDNHGWYTHITQNNYKFVGQRELLLWRHQDDPYTTLTRKTGQGVWSGIKRERVKCWVVEAVNKDPNYVYSKRIWYLDPENWQLDAQEMYDRQGKLWKVYEFGYNEYPGYGGDLVTQTNCENLVDLIRRHGSVGQYQIKKVGVDFPKQMFSIAALQQQTY
ncbi:MAG: outer membrane lipoprotein-sorting protein, partial [Thermodesulfobacteriota bacterium]